MNKTIPNQTTKEALIYAEHQEIYKIVKERENGKTISHDDMLKKLCIDKALDKCMSNGI